MWIVYALLSAFFASATTILAKLGIVGISSNLATAIRTIVVLVLAWGIVMVTGQYKGIQDISSKSLWLLLASGAATCLSWLFFYKAVQLGDASKVVPLDKLSIVFTMVLAYFFLGESIDTKTIIGGRARYGRSACPRAVAKKREERIHECNGAGRGR